MKTSDLFQVGSITKSFIAAIILQIEANPKYNFNINQPLSKWLPQYPQWKDITIKQLLNHTSGIYNSTETILNKTVNKQPNRKWKNEDLVAIAANQPLYFKPGAGWHYSNTNYILAGMVIEAVTNKSIEQEMKALIKKANLNNTFYTTSAYSSKILDRLVHGYNLNKRDITEENMSWAGAAGALVSNSEDMDKWADALLRPNVILATKQLKEMETLVCQNKEINSGCEYAGMPTKNVNTPTYGLGIAHYKNIWWHDGSTEGYSGIFMNNTSKHITISILSNTGDTHLTNDFYPLNKRITKILLNSSNALDVK